MKKILIITIMLSMYTISKAQKIKLKALRESIQNEIADNKNRSLLTKLIVEACH